MTRGELNQKLDADLCKKFDLSMRELNNMTFGSVEGMRMDLMQVDLESALGRDIDSDENLRELYVNIFYKE